MRSIALISMLVALAACGATDVAPVPPEPAVHAPNSTTRAPAVVVVAE